MRERKYRKGKKLTFEQASKDVLDGKYVFFFDKPIHPGWVSSWSVRLLNGYCLRGYIFQAVMNTEKDNA